jgi:hypothetical protein
MRLEWMRRIGKLDLLTVAGWLAVVMLVPYYYENRDQLSLWEILLAILLLNATSFATVVLLLGKLDRHDEGDDAF